LALIGQLPFETSVPATYATELDATGTELWNYATRVRRNGDTSPASRKPNEVQQQAKIRKAACLLRVLAALMLAASWQASARFFERQAHDRTRLREFQMTVRLTKALNKAAKACLQQDELDLCTRVLERAAACSEELGSTKLDSAHDNHISQRLQSEYFVLRTALVSCPSRSSD
jgi:hypothetical protein